MFVPMDKAGELSLLALSKAEKDTLLRYLAAIKGDDFLDFLETFGGDNFLKLLDCFAGQTIKFPERRPLLKIISYVKLYCYVRAVGETEEGYQKAASVFNRRVTSVKRITEKVKQIIAVEEDE